MKKTNLLITAISVLIICCSLGCNSISNPQNNEDFAFVNVSIITMENEVILENQTLIVRDGKILKIGPTSKVKNPKGATLIDATGKFLIPSLTDMHVHLEGEAWNIMYPPELKYTPEEINYSDILFQYIANGITTINVMSAFPEHLVLRDSIKNKKLLGPELVLSKMIDGAGQAWPPPISTWVNNSDEAKNAVIDAYNSGYDRIKAYSFLDIASYDTIIKTAQTLNMPVDGHIPLSASVEHVATSGQKMIAHSEEIMNFVQDFSPEEIETFVTVLAENKTWVTATLITTRNLINLLDNSEEEFTKPGVEYLHPMGMDIRNYIYENLYKPIPETHRQYIKSGFTTFQIPFVHEFHKKGGNLLAGTDALIPPTLPGISLHKELEELVNAGLSPFEALKISTTNSHRFLENIEEAGTIEEGKVANLVLLDKNPLTDISNTKAIEGVFTQEQWISKNQIEKRLSEIVQSYVQLKNAKNN